MLPKLPRPISTFLVAFAWLGIAWSVTAQPLERLPKLDSALTERVLLKNAARQQVIIRVKDGNPAALAATLRALGETVGRVYPGIGSIAASLTVDQIRALSAHHSVASISTDAVVLADQTTTSPYTVRGTLGLPVLSPGGSRIGIAVIDSGIEPGPEFGDRIVAFYDFTQGGIARPASDAYGHGTHVAGLIAGDGRQSQKRYRGVAHKARLIVLKVLDENGQGRTSDVISAIEYATANKDQLGIEIINLSLGHPIYEPAETDPLVQAVEAAARAGIHVVASAGNYGLNPETSEPGYAGIVSPANAPSAIAVGAETTVDTKVRSDDRVTRYSSRGPSWYDGTAKPDLVAPGHAMVSVAARSSSLYLNNPGLRVGDSYLRLSGTSMAAGVVSGTLALVIEANRTAFAGSPPLTPNAAKALLQFTALKVHDELGAEYDTLTQGAGSVNPAGAIDLASKIDPSAPVASWWLTTGDHPDDDD